MIQHLKKLICQRSQADIWINTQTAVLPLHVSSFKLFHEPDHTHVFCFGASSKPFNNSMERENGNNGLIGE